MILHQSDHTKRCRVDIFHAQMPAKIAGSNDVRIDVCTMLAGFCQQKDLNNSSTAFLHWHIRVNAVCNINDNADEDSHGYWCSSNVIWPEKILQSPKGSRYSLK
jgi:hypothetical protein